MYTTRGVLTREMLLRGQHINTSIMKASQFCEKWIPILYGLYPTDRGYKAACIRELAQLTKLTERTIKSWGDNLDNHPETVDQTLYWANIGYGVKHVLGFKPNQKI